MSRGKAALKLLASVLVFFAVCGFVITCSFLLFFHGMELTEAQIGTAAKLTFGNTLIIAVLFAVLDQVRRRITVDKPVKQIQDALARITGGDFGVVLDPDTVSPNFAAIMESINHMTAELSGVETLRTDFVANVSHEMKTPLAVIQNYGVLLQTENLPEEKRQEYARAVTEAARRLADLMTNILKLNRLENQQIYPQTKTYDLGEQLRCSLLQFETVWEDKDIDIDADIADDVLIREDEELLALVWNNLLSNAFKFTGPGGLVSVRLAAEGPWAVAEITDTGCGMSPEVGAHIFEKFYQGDTSHATQGNGLGLALVKRIMDITGGTITVKSEPNVGSSFTVRLRRLEEKSRE